MEKDKIYVEHAVKRYRETTALQDVTLHFKEGKITGLVGRNGSGKTVLLKAVCGLVKLDEGSIEVDGKKLGGKTVLPGKMGIIIETPGFYRNFSGYDNLKYLADIRGKIGKKEVKEAIRKVGLDPESRKWVGKYSLGMRQRLGIAQAIMENPEILILDEPTNGLDKKGVEEFRELIRSLKEEGKTILMASHNAEDIGQLCDVVYELDGGKLVGQE